MSQKAGSARGKDEGCFMQISEIKNARNRGDYDVALAGCLELLGRDEGDMGALRLRASIHSLKKNYKEALQDYRSVIASDSVRISDFYLAADAALLLEEYEQACEWLTRVVEIGAEIEDDAFDSAAHFLLAYSQMQTCKYEQALESLKNAVAKDPKVALPLPGESGVASAQHLRTEINKRKNK